MPAYKACARIQTQPERKPNQPVDSAITPNEKTDQMNTFSVIRRVNDDSSEGGARFIIKSTTQKPGQADIGGSCTIQQMEDELRFWKLETPALLKLLNKLDYRKLVPDERTRLSEIQEELISLPEEAFPAHELALESIRQDKAAKRERLWPIEQDHLKLKQAYCQLKLDLFALLPKMIPVAIW